MDYLTATEMAELKGCSLQNIQKLLKDGKIQAKQELNCKGKTKYLIPVSTLSEDLQAKYYKRKRTEAGIMPEKIEDENSSETAFKYRLKGVSKAFEEFSEVERAEIKLWIDLLNKWQTERSERKDKTEFDKLFVAHQKYINPDTEIGPDILYRKYSPYKNDCYCDPIDKRRG